LPPGDYRPAPVFESTQNRRVGFSGVWQVRSGNDGMSDVVLARFFYQVHQFTSLFHEFLDRSRRRQVGHETNAESDRPLVLSHGVKQVPVEPVRGGSSGVRICF
jgi:hypothetical protein